jgi:Integrase zinc binding domain
MEMLLQKNSVVHVTKPDELDDAWMRDSTGLWRNGHITWVPTDVQESVLSHEHDLPAAGHPGARKMKSALLKSYWWVDMVKDAEQYVSGCEMCQ